MREREIRGGEEEMYRMNKVKRVKEEEEREKEREREGGGKIERTSSTE